MKIPRDISGDSLVKALCKSWGYRQIHQVGSHVILETESPSHQRMSIPSHKSLRIGTINSILRAVANHKGVNKNKIIETL